MQFQFEDNSNKYKYYNWKSRQEFIHSRKQSYIKQAMVILNNNMHYEHRRFTQKKFQKL